MQGGKPTDKNAVYAAECTKHKLLDKQEITSTIASIDTDQI